MENPDIDIYISRSTAWPNEIAAVRTILLSKGLDESIKWMKPCYSQDGANIAILQEMKSFLSLMFFKGALMADPAGVLESQGANSRSALRMTFRSVDDVERLAGVIADYVDEAIAVEASGVELPRAPELELVAELQERLASDPELADAFYALTPGRQREYHLHIADAQQSSTRVARLDKCAPRILAGLGLRDR